MTKTLAAALMLLCLNVSAHAECLTKEEREAARIRYGRCMSEAAMALSRNLQAWNSSGCDTFPQPRNCLAPYPWWEKEKKNALRNLRQA